MRFRWILIIPFFYCLAASYTGLSSNAPDTASINRSIERVTSLIGRREYSPAKELSYRLLANADRASYRVGKARVCYLLGLSYSRLHSIDSATFYLNKSEKLFDNNNSEERIALAEVYRAKAEVCKMSGMVDSTENHYLKAISTIERDGYSRLLVNSLFDISALYIAQCQYNEALRILDRAFKEAVEFSDTGSIAIALKYYGILYSSKGNFMQSLEYFFRAEKLFDEVGNKRGIASVLNNIGVVYRDIGDLQYSRDYLKRALALSAELADTFGMSYTLGNLGSVYKLERRYDSALVYLDRAIALKDTLADRSDVAKTLIHKAEIYRNQKKFRESIALLELARLKYDQAKEPRGQADVMISLGITYMDMGIPQKALACLNEGLYIASSARLSDKIRDAHHVLYQLYSLVGDCAKSLYHLERYNIYRDSVVNLSLTRQVVEYQIESQLSIFTRRMRDDQQREFDRAQDRSRKQTTLSYFFMLAFGLTLVILIFIYLNNRQKQKSNDTLAFQKLEMERQKHELTLQRDELEIQKNLVVHQRDKIITMLTDLGESIDYARKIQQAILPTDRFLRKVLGDHFILFQPRESVGGDFYWAATYENLICFAAADCTGHGVPGGFMSMLGVSMLNDLVSRPGSCSPSQLLDSLRDMIIKALNQTGKDEDSQDGMDISLCIYNPQTRMLSYAGANLPVFLHTTASIEPNERVVFQDNLVELRPDRMPVSYYQRMDHFDEVHVNMNAGDVIYLFSDGFVDQFGGEHSKKFGYTAFRSLINSVKHLPLDEQKMQIWTALERWKNEENQTDDILVMGIRIT